MPDATTPSLLPCPFCGSVDVGLSAEDGHDFVVCSNCGAEGPFDYKNGIAAWNQRSTWQPIETAPRDGTQILAIWPGKGRPRIVWFDRARWTDDGDHSLIDFTHWQPLPSPPITPSPP